MQTYGKNIEVGDVEINSGVEFPGENLEKLVDTNLTFESKRPENSIIFCEIGTPNFRYKFKNEEKAFIGECKRCEDKQHLV